MKNILIKNSLKSILMSVLILFVIPATNSTIARAHSRTDCDENFKAGFYEGNEENQNGNNNNDNANDNGNNANSNEITFSNNNNDNANDNGNNANSNEITFSNNNNDNANDNGNNANSNEITFSNNNNDNANDNGNNANTNETTLGQLNVHSKSEPLFLNIYDRSEDERNTYFPLRQILLKRQNEKQQNEEQEKPWYTDYSHLFRNESQ